MPYFNLTCHANIFFLFSSERGKEKAGLCLEIPALLHRSRERGEDKDNLFRIVESILILSAQ